jgi:hypothetical protein
MLQSPNHLMNRRRQAVGNKVFRSIGKKYLTPLSAFVILAGPKRLCGRERQIKVEEVLKATRSCDSSPTPAIRLGNRR